MRATAFDWPRNPQSNDKKIATLLKNGNPSTAFNHPVPSSDGFYCGRRYVADWQMKKWLFMWCTSPQGYPVPHRHRSPESALLAGCGATWCLQPLLVGNSHFVGSHGTIRKCMMHDNLNHLTAFQAGWRTRSGRKIAKTMCSPNADKRRTSVHEPLVHKPPLNTDRIEDNTEDGSPSPLSSPFNSSD
jgi:hypothetical protein